MKIKRYMGKDMQEVMLKVKFDLGSNAIILNTRKIKQKGFLKFFNRPLVEVLAAVDETATIPRQDVSSPKKELLSRVEETETVSEISQQYDKKDNMFDLEMKINQIGELLQKIYSDIKPQNKTGQRSESSNILDIFENNLIANNVDRSVPAEIIGRVRNSVSNDANINEVATKIYNEISELLGEARTIEMQTEKDSAKVVIFVGPTGVGKTTTLAKLAAIFSINYKKDLGIITSDTYRIAAVEQLKTYTEILGIPIKVIYSPEEIQEAISSFQDKDLILIDTAGRSHKDEKQFEELKQIIELGNPDEVFLLISSTTDYNVCKEIVQSYSFIKDYKIIITKMDEGTSPGMILNIKNLTKNSLSYITVGQSVPDDIEVIDISSIAKNVMGSIRT